MSEQSISEYDVAIIGGGPAGLAAAAYLHRAALRRTVLIAESLGGKVYYPFSLRDLPNVDHVWGGDLCEELEQFVKDQLQEIEETVVKRVAQKDGLFHIQLGDDRDITARTVIVTTGAGFKRTYVVGEKRLWGSGVSFSAISHALHFEGRPVAVVGNGPRALVAALELAAIASRVYLIAPRLHKLAELPAANLVLEHPDVTVFRHWELQQIVGDDFVSAVQLVGINGEVRQVPVEGVFVQLELLPNNDIVRDLVDLDHYGFIKVNQRCETNVEGLFAAGDITDARAELVPVALGEGAKAALSAWEYLTLHERN
jgi:alkyl hydroperoxide reductase subunit F